MSSGEQQQRRFDLVDEVDWRAVFVERFVLDHIAHGRQIGLLQHWIFILNLSEPVHKRHDGHTRGPHVGRFRD